MYLYERIEREKKEREKLEKLTRPQLPPNDRPNNDKSYVTMLTSASHTLGNALAYIQNWVINLFPENLFKTIHVNSKIAHRQIRSTSHEFLKKSKPMIIFRPRIASYDEERFLSGTPLIQRQMDIYSTYGATALQPFFDDPEHEVTMKYQMNRSILYVDVILIFSTLMQQIDYRNYLENAVRWDMPFTLSTCFESFMPQEMLKIISDIVHIPLYDADGSTYDFVRFMNQHSISPVTYKFRGASGTREFYRYYPVNVETTFSNLNTDEGEMSGTVANRYQIDFSIKMEFNSTGFYYLFSNNIFNMPLPKIDGESTDIIPVFTDIILQEDLHLQPGWVLYNRAGVRLEDPNDTLNIDSMLNLSIRTAIDYHLKNGLPMMDLIDLKIRKQGRLVRYGEVYTMDWETKNLKFINQDTFHTYTILICINIEYINNLMKTLYKLK